VRASPLSTDPTSIVRSASSRNACAGSSLFYSDREPSSATTGRRSRAAWLGTSATSPLPARNETGVGELREGVADRTVAHVQKRRELADAQFVAVGRMKHPNDLVPRLVPERRQQLDVGAATDVDGAGHADADGATDFDAVADADAVVDQLTPGEETQYLFFTGKGGVGKSTVASTAATKLAEAGHETLVVTTDPAAHLEDIFGEPVGHEPTSVGQDNLDAARIDQEKALAEYREQVLDHVTEMYEEKENTQIDRRRCDRER